MILRDEALLCPEFLKDEITNLEIPAAFSKKDVLNLHHVSRIAQFTNKKSISEEIFVSVQSWTTSFCTFFSSWPFHTNFFPDSIPKIYEVIHELYLSWLVATAAMIANVKCIVAWLYVAIKKEKKLYGPFLWMGFKAKGKSHF